MGNLGDPAAATIGASVPGWVREDFGVELASVEPVGGGADAAAAVWRGVAADGRSYAVKWSRAGLAPGLLVCGWLAARGVPGVPRPLPARSGGSHSARAGGDLSVTAWVSGRRGADGGLDAGQWRAFGALMARLHAADPPERVRAGIRYEDFPTAIAATARGLDDRMRDGRTSTGGDELTRAVVDAWLGAGEVVATLARHTESLGSDLRGRESERVLCHADAHTGNVMVDPDGLLWLLDWDGTCLAPRERDLMFVVGGVLDPPVTERELWWFLDGYGPVRIDPARLAYYRCTWALEDLTSFADFVLDEVRRPAEDRAVALRIFRGLLTPTSIVQQALTSLRELRTGP